jgi:endonuclease/exonuclease/phosphatase family metal-dependent hydrolase
VWLSHSNARSSSERLYDLAFFSVFPLESQIYIDTATIWHSLIHVIINTHSPLHVIAAHFSPRSEDWRLKEVPRINDLLRKHGHEPMILLGDLNSLSPHDPYPQTLQVQLHAHNITKFGNHPRFDVITALEQAGWYDALHQTIRSAQDATKLHITVREEAEDTDHLNLRLDYVMVNEMVLPRVKRVIIEDTPQIRDASDHFPVVAEIADSTGACGPEVVDFKGARGQGPLPK